MPEKNQSKDKASPTLDLSTGKKGKSKKTRKGPAPVVQQTINLSTPKPETSQVASQLAAIKTTPPTRAEGKKRERTRSQGNSLADLLDPATLKKLLG